MIPSTGSARTQDVAVDRDFNYAILNETAHRPWKMPEAPWVMTQTWHDLLFAHWRIDPIELAGKVPGQFRLDLFAGQAWIGIVPFRMTNVAPRGVPSLPWMSEFPELNVRTYVRVGDRPGVYFFSLDAGSAVAVRAARTLLNLPYFSASMVVTRMGNGVDYSSRRHKDGAQLSGAFGPAGPQFAAAAGSLEYFLTERYCLYNLDRRGRPYRLEIHHPPWALQRAHARLTCNSMAEANGLSLPAQQPLLHFAKRQDTLAWPPTRL
jgi:uncharacterized protein YqjF (DUF2071 family)